MSSHGGYVCWEWRRDDGGYCPYTPEESNALEVAYTAKKRQCTLGTYIVNFQTMKQCKHALGLERRVHRINADLSQAAIEIVAYWNWSDFPGHFVPYQTEASVDIEMAFQSKKRQVNLEKCPSRLPYTINFANMNQTRHHFMTKRDIKRVTLPPGTSLQSLLKANAASVVTGAVVGSLAGGSGFTGLGVSASTVPPLSHSFSVHTTSTGYPSSHYHSASGVGAPFSTGYPSVPPAGHASVLGSSYGSAMSKSGSAPLYSSTTASSFHHSGHLSVTGHRSHSSTPGLSYAHTTPHVAGISHAPTTVSVPPYYHLPPAMSASGVLSTPASTHHLPATLASSSALPHHHHHHPFSSATITTTTAMSAFTSGPLYHPSSTSPYLASTTTLAAAAKSHASTKAITTATSTTTAAPKSRVKGRIRSGGRGKSSAASVDSPKPSSKSSSSSRGKDRRSARTTKKSVGGGATSSDPLDVYAKKLERLKPKHDEICPICMNKLSEPSGFEDEVPASSPSWAAKDTLNVYKLRKCGHKLHYACLTMYLKNSSKDGFICPTCKKPYGVKTGDMPDGEMSVQTYHSPLPGHSNYGTIVITYNFRAGTYKGKRYRANGFPRVCYLPDSPKGKKVLELLRVAWDRRLTFTIGTSVTTGAVDTVVWNEIHHKTESTSNHSGHGYPDPAYLDRVLLELAAQGVEDTKEEEEEDVPTSSDSSDEEEEEASRVGKLNKTKTKMMAEKVDISSDDDEL